MTELIEKQLASQAKTRGIPKVGSAWFRVLLIAVPPCALDSPEAAGCPAGRLASRAECSRGSAGSRVGPRSSEP